MTHQRPWGPSHNPDLPGGIQLGKTGGYWWGIAAGTVLSAPLLIRTTTGQSPAGQSAWLVIAVMAVAALAVGAGEARRRLPFASGRWVLFSVATFVVLASAWGIPAIAYLLGYYGWPRYAAHRQRSKTAAAAAGRGAKTGIRLSRQRLSHRIDVTGRRPATFRRCRAGFSASPTAASRSPRHRVVPPW